MIMVRFPSGFSVRYNDMNYVSWSGEVAYLYPDSKACGEKGVGWKVRIPPECLIEFINPSQTYDAAANSPILLEQEIRLLRTQIESIKRLINKKK